jgi:hypothetical protein
LASNKSEIKYEKPSDVTAMTLDVNSSLHYYVRGLPFAKSGSVWSITLPALPSDVPLTFTAKA